MIKFIPILFLGILVFVASCAHKSLEDHFNKPMNGWTKSQVMEKFGTPNKSNEDSDYYYYIYYAKSSKKPPRIWQIKYVFEHNNLIRVEKSLKPTAEELEVLENKAL